MKGDKQKIYVYIQFQCILEITLLYVLFIYSTLTFAFASVNNTIQLNWAREAF